MLISKDRSKIINLVSMGSRIKTIMVMVGEAKMILMATTSTMTITEETNHLNLIHQLPINSLTMQEDNQVQEGDVSLFLLLKEDRTMVLALEVKLALLILVGACSST